MWTLPGAESHPVAWLLAASLIAVFAAATPAFAGGVDRPTGGPFATRSVVMAPHAMAATSHPLATQIALDVMRRGGSAVDGAIAANAALGLMEPTGCGIGGDLFALVWDPVEKALVGYNASGPAPRGLSVELLKERGLEAVPRFGPLPVTVPGCVDGWFALHERFGAMAMEDVLAPAIAYARGGFPVTPVIADLWALSAARFADMPNFQATFTLAGRAPRAGEVWKNPALAKSYERIAREGRDGFYRGRTGEVIASFLQSQGGVMTSEDLASFRGEWVTPISTNYRGVDVWQLPPNGQGLAALQILNIMEGFDVRGMGFGSAEYVHTFVEAKKLAFEDRARYYADPKFAKTPVQSLLSKDYAAQRRSLIDPARAARTVEPGDFPSGADTVYLCVADERGMMVSLIQSNYRGMGSGMAPADEQGSLGFMLQNRGEQCATKDGHPNRLEPGKRPFHTIIPGFITKDGQPWVAFGVMGGAMQPQGHAQIVMNLVDFGMDLQEAGDAPRIHHDGSTEPEGPVKPMTTGGVLNLESAFGPLVQRELLQRGHMIQAASPHVFGGYQAILRDPATGMYHGASESRKDGHAAGF